MVDFIRHVKFDYRWTACFRDAFGFAAPQPGFSMAGRTPDALLRRMERWHAELHRNGAAPAAPVESWLSCGIPRTARGGNEPGTYHGVGHRGTPVGRRPRAGGSRDGPLRRQLCYRCAVGGCSIWRVKAAVGSLDTERWTVEVNRERVIVQVRGKRNATARGEVLDVLRDWAARERLSLAAWLGR